LKIQKFRNQTLSEWWNKSVGISGITFTEYFDSTDNATRTQHNIIFEKALPSNNYVVVGSAPTTKLAGGLALQRFTGTHFFGVLYNGTA